MKISINRPWNISLFHEDKLVDIFGSGHIVFYLKKNSKIVDIFTSNIFSLHIDNLFTLGDENNSTVKIADEIPLSLLEEKILPIFDRINNLKSFL